MTRLHQRPFPQNLTWAEERAVKLLIEHGQTIKVARALGVHWTTIGKRLNSAVFKAGALHNAGLIAAYTQAKHKPWLQDAWELHQALRRDK